MKKKPINIEKARAALRREIKKNKWEWQISKLLRLAGIHKNNFYVFLDGRRGLTEDNLVKALKAFQLNVNDFRS